mmetsp:Transcript_15846/g.22566  ORF Transcript_15846/g.22566 Transcript_15846/m.22566 type:complete len:101 (-) Transcript_15846:316-618(-)|eukprot:CAMPEP_0184864806 /NCGR_PEP_ID=MMETSP0580-20130426/16101_1 /TAXON_ID=1118495 /ORGANISM="Dactyliosolen fragilissimus" /LENGTH=100 /DNA_ID=CAMNT_0027363725 /DNA_START=96 /DNA_END=398 /DNA_ORIENTATION=+
MVNPLAELGLSEENGKIEIEHAILISATSAVEQAFRQALVSLTNSSRETSRVMKLVGYAAATYLVLSGVARVIEASSSKSGNEEGRKGGNGGGNGGGGER